MQHKFITFSILFILAITSSGCEEASHNEHASESSSIASTDAHREDEGEHGDHHDEGEGKSVEMSPKAADELGIVVSEIYRAEIARSLDLPAEIRFDADRIANVSPNIGGIIATLYASEGDEVSRGDTLALIKSRELTALKADWQTAETRKKLARKTLTREEQLFADGITAESDLQSAQAEYEAAKAESAAAESQLHAAGISHASLERIPSAPDGENANAYLRAPVSGTIVRRNVTLGEAVSAEDSGADPLFTIIDNGVVWVDVAIYKQDISRIRVGAPVIVKTGNGDILAQSSIAYILPVIDEASRTATARVIAENPDGRLLPGLFVTVEISTGENETVLQVPSKAIVEVDGRKSVFVPTDHGFEPRPVTSGYERDGRTVVLSGLAEGDRYVSEGAFTLKAQLEKDAFGDGHNH